MGYSENIEYIEQLEEENEELKDQMDSVVNEICNIIDVIGERVSKSECRDCIETATRLYEMLREYGDENAQIHALERFAFLTGIHLDEY